MSLQISTIVSNCLHDVQKAHQTARSSGDKSQGTRQYWCFVMQMLNQISTLPDNERVSINDAISVDEGSLLRGIPLSAAIRSIRENDPGKLRYGLMALLLENLHEDYRESLRMITLLKHSADKLGVDLQAIFEEVKYIGGPESRELFEQYFARSGSTLEAMAYVEATDKNGEFTYKSMIGHL